MQIPLLYSIVTWWSRYSVLISFSEPHSDGPQGGEAGSLGVGSQGGGIQLSQGGGTQGSQGGGGQGGVSHKIQQLLNTLKRPKKNRRPIEEYYTDDDTEGGCVTVSVCLHVHMYNGLNWNHFYIITQLLLMIQLLLVQLDQRCSQYQEYH